MGLSLVWSMCNTASTISTESRSKGLAGFLSGADFSLQFRGPNINQLKLGKMRVEDADNLGDLFEERFKNSLSNVSTVSIPRNKCLDRKGGMRCRKVKHTGSSALFDLLSVVEALFTSSIMLVRSFPTSSRRSESLSANL